MVVSTTSQLARVATGRTESFLAEDLELKRDELSAAVAGKRILAIGAAGSIGKSTIECMIGFDPETVVVVDQNENELAELIRGLRSRRQGLAIGDFRTIPMDYGSPAMRLLLHSEQRFDIILNFAAIKHVRSEKDVFSMLHMFDTNFRKQAQLLSWLSETGFAGRYFSVSTDKAANPSSVMGASKRVMEHVMFWGEINPDNAFVVTSARFANVAFSNGSLLEAFGRRIERREPIPCPSDTRRYFVSLEESGHLCTLAALCAPHGAIVVPRLDPEKNLTLLEDVASTYIKARGYEPVIYDDEDVARNSVDQDQAAGKWPLLMTPLNTMGEKPYEEFVGAHERLEEWGLPNLQLVPYQQANGMPVGNWLKKLDRFYESAMSSEIPSPLQKEELTDLLADIEPDFAKTHKSAGEMLDSRI